MFDPNDQEVVPGVRVTDMPPVLTERRAVRETERWPEPIESKPPPGMRIRLVFEGHMSEPVTVTDHQGRSDEHLVLRGPCGLFEHYWDPYNTYPE